MKVGKPSLRAELVEARASRTDPWQRAIRVGRLIVGEVEYQVVGCNL